MWFKFKNVSTLAIETFYLLLITILLGNPFNVKQLDNIVVMASTTKTTLAAIMANDSALKQSTAAATTTTTAKIVPSPVLSASLSIPSATATATTTTTAAAASTLSNSFIHSKTTGGNDVRNINNSARTRTTARNDSNEIDTLNDDSDNSYETAMFQNYIITKRIVLSTKSTQLPVTTTIGKTTRKAAVAATATTTTKSISPTINTNKIKTRTTTTTSTTNQLIPAMSSMSPILELKNDENADDDDDDDNDGDHRTILHLNKTRLDVLASLSLLSATLLNDSTANLTTDLKSDSSTSFTSASLSSSKNASVSVSVSTSTLAFPNHEALVTAHRHRENEHNMHNTNSHLTVDNANAAIVSAKKTSTVTATATVTTITTKHQLQTKKDAATKYSLLNASSIAKGSANVTTGNGSKSNAHISELNVANGNNNKSGTGTTRISARKVDSSKHTLLKATHKTDAPMLNYIFDTFSSANKHHHHDQRYGPHFEDVQLVGQPTNMTVQAGSSIHLNCRISLLQDKTVSWVRRNSQGENALDLLTVGLHTYTGDKRYKMEFQYPSNWRLKISNVKKDDEAAYECQISTHPPRVIQINLHVNAPKVMIVDEFGDPLQEKYYEQDSTLQLSCVVRNVAMSSSVVFWKHSEDVLNYDVTRGGVSVKTELMDDGANSTLFIAKINKADSGNYTCSISEYQNYTIVVHILNGESFAELHHGMAFSWQQVSHQTWLINLVLATILLLLLPAYIYR